MLENYGEAAEALKGATEILEDMYDPKIWTVIAALRSVEEWIANEFDTVEK